MRGMSRLQPGAEWRTHVAAPGSGLKWCCTVQAVLMLYRQVLVDPAAGAVAADACAEQHATAIVHPGFWQPDALHSLTASFLARSLHEVMPGNGSHRGGAVVHNLRRFLHRLA